MLDSFTGSIVFVSNDLGEVVQTANHDLLGPVVFYGIGSWTLLDSLKVKSGLSVNMGIFYSNNNYISCVSFGASTKSWKELYLSTSRIDVWTGSVGVRQDSTYIDPGTSEFHLYTDTTVFKTTYLPQRHFWTVIFEENSLGTEMFVVQSGKVRLTTNQPGSEVDLGIVGPGEFFGEMALVDRSPRTATATADEDDTKLVVLDEERFLYLAGQQLPFAMTIMQGLCRRIRDRWDLYSKVSKKIRCE